MGETICCVRNCGRRAKSKSEFCERCWLQLTDDERSGYLYAVHAPCFNWRHSVVVDDDLNTALPDNHSVEFHDYDRQRRYGFYATYGMPFHDVMREYEHRTTRDTVSAALWDRRWRANVAAQPAP